MYFFCHSLPGVNLASVNEAVLKKLTNLRELDISNNKISSLGFHGITLGLLKELNCASNNLTTVDDFALFPNLEMVDVSNNVSLEVVDRYKLVSMLPKLKVLDNMDVSVMREAVNKLDGDLATKVTFLSLVFSRKIPIFLT